MDLRTNHEFLSRIFLIPFQWVSGKWILQNDWLKVEIETMAIQIIIHKP